MKLTTLLAAVAALLVACASPGPNPRLYQLRAAPRRAALPVPVPVPVVPVATAQVLLLMSPVLLPEVLERDALLVPQGQAGVQALAGHRWAEPLRDAVPRLLRQDLATLLGDGRVWSAPLPAGVVATLQLRVEVLALQANAARKGVSLQVRWTLAAASTASAAAAPPHVATSLIEVSSAGPDADALVAAHRLALWRLAELLAAALR